MALSLLIVKMNNQTPMSQRAKIFSLYVLSILVGFSLILTSCKKKVATPTVKTEDVYVAGSVDTTIFFGTLKVPAYWKNGVRTTLMTNTAGSVTAIAVNGNTVYSVGYITSTPGQVLLWKNKTTPIKVTLDGEAEAYATSIALSDIGDIYVAGYQNDGIGSSAVAKFWKVPANGNSSTSLPLSKGSYKSNDTYANGIAIVGYDIYTTGIVYNGSKNIAVIWRNGGSYIPLTNGTFNAFGEGIATSGNNVYISGYENNTIKCWKYDGISAAVTPLYSLGTTGSSGTSINCIAVGNNKVYIAGYDYSATPYKAMYWNNGSPFILPTSSTDEHTSAIAVAGNNVYVTGFFTDAQTMSRRSILWKNGKKVSGLDGSQNIDAEALFVVKN